MIKEVIMDDNGEEGRIAEDYRGRAKDWVLGASTVRIAVCNRQDVLD